MTATFVNATANIRTTGNVFAANFYGDHYGNVVGNVTSATFIIATANIKTSGNVLGDNLFGNLVGNVTATFVNATANIRTTGNVLATNLFGDLTGNVTATFVNATANIRTTGNVIVGGTLIASSTGTFNSNMVLTLGSISFAGRSVRNLVNLYGNTGAAATSDAVGLGTATNDMHICVLNDRYVYFNGGGWGSAVLMAGSSINSGWNAAATCFFVGKHTTTSRSINAAGTINASGADYAEYMTKAGDFTFLPGAVVGINANGFVTNVFADSVAFAVKSTDPSLVGGDVWGTEAAVGVTKPGDTSTDRGEKETDAEYAARMTAVAAWDAALEAARQRVDRIAFSGQVPCNVYGATPGQYIVPRDPGDGSVVGQAITVTEFADFNRSVGKVVKILSDGRAYIFVRMA